jgi:hypothetical protein
LIVVVVVLYGVETKHVNQAVKNNPEKFPENFILFLNKEDWNDLRSKFLTANQTMSRVVPIAITEKGLYMLATILKSNKATETGIAIVEAFANLRSLKQQLHDINLTDDPMVQNFAVKKTGEVLSELLGNDLTMNNTETT